VHLIAKLAPLLAYRKGESILVSALYMCIQYSADFTRFNDQLQGQEFLCQTSSNYRPVIL